MDVSVICTVIGTGIAVVGSLSTMMWAMLRFLLKDIHKDLTDIKARLDRSDARMDKSEGRVDHLYHICIEMLKTRR